MQLAYRVQLAHIQTQRGLMQRKIASHVSQASTRSCWVQFPPRFVTNALLGSLQLRLQTISYPTVCHALLERMLQQMAIQWRQIVLHVLQERTLKELEFQHLQVV